MDIGYHLQTFTLTKTKQKNLKLDPQIEKWPSYLTKCVAQMMDTSDMNGEVGNDTLEEH